MLTSSRGGCGHEKNLSLRFVQSATTGEERGPPDPHTSAGSTRIPPPLMA
ncbi:hypothetical protein LINPERHAP1_LOCUS18905 [Linum perenne]